MPRERGGPRRAWMASGRHVRLALDRARMRPGRPSGTDKGRSDVVVVSMRKARFASAEALDARSTIVRSRRKYLPVAGNSPCRHPPKPWPGVRMRQQPSQQPATGRGGFVLWLRRYTWTESVSGTTDLDAKPYAFLHGRSCFFELDSFGSFSRPPLGMQLPLL